MAGIQYWADRLGAGHMYGLLACIVTARSWNAISKGIDRKAFSEEEVGYLYCRGVHCIYRHMYGLLTCIVTVRS